MNKKFLTIGAIAFIMGVSANYALSVVPTTFNIAVVDVQKVVSESSQVASLKDEQKTKTQEMVKFVENARKDVAKETDKAKKKALEDKYNAQLNEMKKSMDNNYKEKLTAIDSNISKVIQKTAQENGYSIVLAKTIVLYGGTDITKEIEKSVK